MSFTRIWQVLRWPARDAAWPSYDVNNVGSWGEQVARMYLERHGFELVAANWRCSYGEIDLVMRDSQELVFVEVKTRGREDYGDPMEVVDERKQAKLIRTAKHYIQEHEEWGAARFDVVGVSTREGSEPEIEHVKWAIEAE